MERDTCGRDPEKRRAAQRRQYAANSAHILARQKARLSDPEVQERKSAYFRAWYQANRERVLANSKARYDADPQAKADRVAVRRHRLRVFIREHKEGKQCVQCGFSDPRALDFHHRDDTRKEIDLSRAWQRGWSLKRIAQEIAKCDVLCANCHRILHADVCEEP